MYVKIDLFSGESEEMKMCKELKEELNSCLYSKDVIEVWLSEEVMYVKKQKQVGGAIEVEYIVKYNGGIDCPFI